MKNYLKITNQYPYVDAGDEVSVDYLIENLIASIGSLSGLRTWAKGSVVAAINEIELKRKAVIVNVGRSGDAVTVSDAVAEIANAVANTKRVAYALIDDDLYPCIRAVSAEGETSKVVFAGWVPFYDGGDSHMPWTRLILTGTAGADTHGTEDVWSLEFFPADAENVRYNKVIGGTTVSTVEGALDEIGETVGDNAFRMMRDSFRRGMDEDYITVPLYDAVTGKDGIGVIAATQEERRNADANEGEYNIPTVGQVGEIVKAQSEGLCNGAPADITNDYNASGCDSIAEYMILADPYGDGYKVAEGRYAINGKLVTVWDDNVARYFVVNSGDTVAVYGVAAPDESAFELLAIDSDKRQIRMNGEGGSLLPELRPEDSGKVLQANANGLWDLTKFAADEISAEYDIESDAPCDNVQSALDRIGDQFEDTLGKDDVTEIELVKASAAVANIGNDMDVLTPAAAQAIAKNAARFEAVYGETTYAAVEEAFNAKIPVFVRLDVTDPNTSVTANVEFRLQRRQDVNASVSFFHFYAEYSELGYFVNLRNNNTWSAVTLRRYIGAIDEDNPSVFNYPSEKAVVDYVAKKLGGGT